MDEQRQRRRETATGALAPDHDASGIDAELARVSMQELERREAIFERRRIRVLGREPVVDADDDDVESLGEASAELSSCCADPRT